MGIFSRKNSSKPQGKRPSVSSTSTSSARPFSKMLQSSSHNEVPTQAHTIPHVALPKAPDPNVDPVAYLRSIYSVRERSRIVMEKARNNQLRHFSVDMAKFADTAKYVVSIIKVDIAYEQKLVRMMALR
jgi:hypothetical protein